MYEVVERVKVVCLIRGYATQCGGLCMPREMMNGIAPMVAKRRARIAIEFRRHVIQDVGCGENDVLSNLMAIRELMQS